MSLLYQTLKRKIAGEKEASSLLGGDESLPLKDMVTQDRKKKGRLKSWLLIGGGVFIFLVIIFSVGNIRRTEKADTRKAPYIGRMAPAMKDVDTNQRSLMDYLKKGISYYEKKDWDKAIIEYKRSILIKPESPELHNDLGVVYYRKGEIDMAIKEIEEAVHLRSDYPEACFNLAIILEDRGNIPEAAEQYRRFVSLAEDRYPLLTGEIKFYLHYR